MYDNGTTGTVPTDSWTYSPTTAITKTSESKTIVVTYTENAVTATAGFTVAFSE